MNVGTEESSHRRAPGNPVGLPLGDAALRKQGREDRRGDVGVAPSFDARSGFDAVRDPTVDVGERTTRGRKLRHALYIGPGKVARHVVALPERDEG